MTMEEQRAKLMEALEQLIIGIGMGWDLDGLVEAARSVLIECGSEVIK